MKKFRAWDGDNKKMLHLFPWTKYEAIGYHFDPADGSLFQVMDIAKGEVRSNFTVMQSTGLLDKAGKEIYEGDITNYGVIKWFDHLTWGLGGSPHPGFYFDDDQELEYQVGFDEEIEVIGNIYEYPKLLEKNHENRS